jgi:tetratricopeptide (TPR) repeat protein/predicted aspartyl protease
MATRSSLPALVLFALCLEPIQTLAAQCTVGKIAELPVTMSGSRPTVPALINGTEARFIADSGAFYSVISPAAAAEFNLPDVPLHENVTMKGIGGSAKASGTTVREFKLAGIRLANVEFYVGGGEPGAGAAGVLGQNVLGIADVEYDLANGAIRLMNPHDCGRANLAYWVTGSQRYSTLTIAKPTPVARHTMGIILVNGKKVRAVFDTGASASMLSLRAAERAGIKPDSPGVEPGGYWRGIGRGAMQTWVAPFESFKIGDEEISHARVRIGALELDNADMLIGADFFLSHRIYVARSQRKLYFTYNGGPVFDLSSSSPLSEVTSATDPGAPTDAAGFSRRGNAFAARRDFERALADLTRACELAPTEAQYFYERGMIHWRNEQPRLAIADFDEALKLEPNDVAAHVARAEAHLFERRRTDALADLDAAHASATKEADVRLEMGILYGRANALPQAIAQYDLWIAAHDRDARMPDALNARCWARALSAQDLEKALEDCNAALELRPDTRIYRASRGLVNLRLGRFDPAIEDFDASLQGPPPRNAFYLYGRGIAKLRQGRTAEGQADIDAALALQPRVAAEAGHFDVTP